LVESFVEDENEYDDEDDTLSEDTA